MALILIVDDNRFSRKMLQRYVDDAGHESMQGCDGKEGLALLKDHDFDMVFSDLLMDGMSGFDFMRILHEQHNTIPRVVISSDIQTSSKERISAYGVHTFINKPFSADDIKNVIDELHSSEERPGDFHTNEIQTVSELVNIGIGKAAASISKMLERRIELSVPFVEVGNIDAIKGVFDKHAENVSVIEQGFRGDIAGSAALIFSPECISTLINILFGANDLQTETSIIHKERESVMSEIGNIFVNGIMGTIGGLINSSIEYKLPCYYESKSDDICSGWTEGNEGFLAASVTFTVENTIVTGNFILIFEIGSLSSLKERLALLQKTQ
ncbi:MAG: response regulator [Planctomycetes bacterium]|nr:response regulator [Planctomycetota bacterium]